MKSSKRKGFTLVELLIVIVVIGILSAMMMMSSTEAVTSAKASNIVSNLRNLKTAALALYTDSLDKFSANNDAPAMKDVFTYLNSGVNIPDSKDYTIAANTKGSWYISYHITGTADEISKIQSKLKGRAKSVGLVSSSDNSAYDGTAGSVAILVR